MTVIGIDDTDSRTAGMCTTYVAHSVAAALDARGASVERTLLVRLNPAVEHKTRGNAALAIHADVDPGVAAEVATEVVADAAVHDDERTNSGVVVANIGPRDAPDAVAAFAGQAVTTIRSRAEAHNLADAHGFETYTWGNGRGVVGALAAVGAYAAFDDWTYEHIAYRERERWGTEREFDHESVFRAADAEYPAVWDTVDHGEDEVVCVPRTPCPILYGIRGDDPDACRRVADAIESEPVAESRTFVTNQGTDVHLTDVTTTDDVPLTDVTTDDVHPTDATDDTTDDIDTLQEQRAYRLRGTVSGDPETRQGGHVFVPFDPQAVATPTDADLLLAAFEPTKRFRDHVRDLRPGDALTVCGEYTDDTINLEKFRVDDLVTTTTETPTCPACGRRMKSAGADQGYRCRDCDTTEPGKVATPIDRTLELGWYEVPPRARRHVAKPLVRGGYDAPTHVER